MFLKLKQLLKDLFKGKNLIVMIPSYICFLLVLAIAILYLTKESYIFGLARLYLAHKPPTLLITVSLLSIFDSFIIFLVTPFLFSLLNSVAYSTVMDRIPELEREKDVIKNNSSREVLSLQDELNTRRKECNNLHGEIKQCINKYKELKAINQQLETTLKLTNENIKKAASEYEEKLNLLAKDYVNLRAEMEKLSANPTDREEPKSEIFDV